MKLLTINDIARELHWSIGTVRNRISRGDEMPPSFKVGRRRLFPADKFEVWLKAFFPKDEGADPRTSDELARRGQPRKADPWIRHV